LKFNADLPAGPKPWTSRDFGGKPGEFRFAIVADRTGGHRSGVFRSAIAKLNLLRPDFVMSVGNLIEGYVSDRRELRRQWDEVLSYTAELEMPFFFVPGSRDISNEAMAQAWQEMFGRRYYSFEYHDVLFLCLDTQEGRKYRPGVGPEQIDWVKKTLRRGRKVKWTFVLMHQPLWLLENGKGRRSSRRYSKEQGTGLAELEDALGDRPYTVFAGASHQYVRFTRNDQRYITLATTGADSQLRGPMFGEFDHALWVAMTPKGPRIANLLLEGIRDEEVHTEDHLRFVDSFSLADEVTVEELPLATRLLFRPKNPFRKGIQGTVEWQVPDGSKWSIEPDRAEIALEAGQETELEFRASFAGGFSEFFPLPGMRIAVSAGDIPIVDRSKLFPVDVIPFLEKHRRTASCRRIAAPPKIDGTLDEPEWKRDPDLKDFVVSSMDRKPSVQTHGWVACDATNLYLAVRCFEPDLEGLRVRTKHRDGPTFKDDSIELFLDMDLDRETYYQIVVNAGGVVYDGLVFDSSWNGVFQQAAGREEDAWTLEMAIPWKTLAAAAPTAGAKMGLELVRTRARTWEIQQWAPTGGGNHSPKMFGTLEFTGK